MPIAPWTWRTRLCSEPPSERASAKSLRSIVKIFPSIAFTTGSDPCFSPDTQRPPFAVYGPLSAPSLRSAAFWSAAVLPPLSRRQNRQDVHDLHGRVLGLPNLFLKAARQLAANRSVKKLNRMQHRNLLSCALERSLQSQNAPDVAGYGEC